MSEFNGFDNIGGIADPEEVARQSAADAERWVKMDHLIHKTFVQSESGAELLAMWRESLVMVPTVTENATQFQAGIREGEKSFVRNILLTINKVENT